MKIAIIVQSDAFLDSAGVRIRYRRFQATLEGSDVEIVMQTIDQLTAAKTFPADAYIFVKTFSPDALVMMAHLSRIGKAVGHDLFDDYFSQWGDARLSRFRDWLFNAVPFTDFAICTTPQIQRVVRSYLPDSPITTVDDPFDQFDLDRLTRTVSTKVQAMRERKHVRIVWFGIGDNPFFPVGLQDLTAHWHTLNQLHVDGWTIALRVVTNRRALNATMLERLNRLPYALTIDEWSVENEAAALDESDVVLLPVNAQTFSMAKSLNRAITAIDHGCQVLSLGYPLYDRLSPLIYRDARMLAADLPASQLALSPESLQRHSATLSKLGDRQLLTELFVNAVKIAIAAKVGLIRKDTGQLCVIHGIESPSPQHKLISRLGGLSVKSPFNVNRWNYHVRIDAADGRYVARVEENLIGTVRPGVAFTGEMVAINDMRYATAILDEHILPSNLPIEAPTSAFLAARIASYPHVMAATAAACRALFPNASIVYSDKAMSVSANSRTIAAPGTRPAERQIDDDDIICASAETAHGVG